MKRNNKKGFTIVELVIVIAVIAILAGVLIPTFAGIVAKANKSNIEQETRASLTVVLAEENGQMSSNAKYYFLYSNDDKVAYFAYENGELVEKKATELDGWDEATKKVNVNANDVIWAASAEAAAAVTASAAEAAATTKVLEDLENVVVVKVVEG